MKPAYVLLATAAIFASAACNAEKGTSATNTDAPIKAVAPPKGGDWTKMVSATPEGGFVMGNPNADVKLVEYGSLTCPHCAEFAEKGAPQLIAKYVKTGRVSYEFRHFLRDGLDMSLSLVARCGGPERYFALSEGIFKDQREFFERAQSATPEQQQQLSTSPAGFAQLAGIQQWAAQRGVPSAKSNACLADQGAMDRLMQTSNDVTTQFPSFSGTPSFVVNGKMLEKTATWELLEPQLREALGS
jgi:protein-disulfide isomerase